MQSGKITLGSWFPSPLCAIPLLDFSFDWAEWSNQQMIIWSLDLSFFFSNPSFILVLKRGDLVTLKSRRLSEISTFQKMCVLALQTWNLGSKFGARGIYLIRPRWVLRKICKTRDPSLITYRIIGMQFIPFRQFFEHCFNPDQFNPAGVIVARKAS